MRKNLQTPYPDWVHRLVGLMGLTLAAIYIFLILQKLAVILRALFHYQ